jgi:hypothetical protein
VSYRAGPGWSCSIAVYKPVWHIPLLSVQWINSWWWTDELSVICRVSCQNKFVKIVHLVGFIKKKFVTMQHGHMNIEYYLICVLPYQPISLMWCRCTKPACWFEWRRLTSDDRQPREQRNFRNGVCWRTFVSVLHCGCSRGKLQQIWSLRHMGLCHGFPSM